MPIYIAHNALGKIESVVLADSYELAAAYFQGKSLHANTILTFTEKDLDGWETGVLPLVSTREVKINNKSEFIID